MADDHHGRRPVGVLATPAPDRWTLQRRPPPPELARYVAWAWAVAWDLRGLEPHVQSTLPHPSAHLVVEDGEANVVGAVDGCRELEPAMDRLLERLRPVPPPVDPADDRALDAVNAIVERIEADRTLRTVDEVAAATGRHRRTVERLLARYVGLGPKAIIRRYRLQEAADAALSGDAVDWADTAARLGYYDQAHLVRDFTDVIGQAPAAYARRHAQPD
ncbi:MAG: helix-turn-helix domain-containing protein [Actinomycetota bacterium]